MQANPKSDNLTSKPSRPPFLREAESGMGHFHRHTEELKVKIIRGGKLKAYGFAEAVEKSYLRAAC